MIAYPLYDLSDKYWASDKEHNIFFEPSYNSISFKSNQAFQNKLFNGLKEGVYVDMEGRSWKLAELTVTNIKGFWRWILFLKRVNVSFSQLEKIYTFDEVKEVVMRRVEEQTNKKFLDSISKASSIREIFNV